VRPVRVHIERLVVPASMREDSAAISRQVQAQVAQQLAGLGDPAGDTRSVARLDGGTAAANPFAIGAAAARAVVKGMGR
jgi:hypothetical protein